MRARDVHRRVVAASGHPLVRRMAAVGRLGYSTPRTRASAAEAPSSPAPGWSSTGFSETGNARRATREREEGRTRERERHCKRKQESHSSSHFLFLRRTGLFLPCYLRGSVRCDWTLLRSCARSRSFVFLLIVHLYYCSTTAT